MLINGVHGRPDGMLMVRLVRRVVRVRSLEAKVAQLGMVVRHPVSGKPMQSPFYTALVLEEAEMRRLMNELGFSPAGRLRFAPPSSARKTEGSWEAFD
jgi:phage terminase small subunit